MYFWIVTIMVSYTCIFTHHIHLVPHHHIHPSILFKQPIQQCNSYWWHDSVSTWHDSYHIPHNMSHPFTCHEWADEWWWVTNEVRDMTHMTYHTVCDSHITWIRSQCEWVTNEPPIHSPRMSHKWATHFTHITLDWVAHSWLIHIDSIFTWYDSFHMHMICWWACPKRTRNAFHMHVIWLISHTSWACAKRVLF